MHDSLKQLVQKLSPQEAKELAVTLGDTIFDTLAISILEAVPDEKLEELEKMIQANDIHALERFLREEAPDLDARMNESLARLRSEAHLVLGT